MITNFYAESYCQEIVLTANMVRCQLFSRLRVLQSAQSPKSLALHRRCFNKGRPIFPAHNIAKVPCMQIQHSRPTPTIILRQQHKLVSQTTVALKSTGHSILPYSGGCCLFGHQPQLSLSLALPLHILHGSKQAQSMHGTFPGTRKPKGHRNMCRSASP